MVFSWDGTISRRLVLGLLVVDAVWAYVIATLQTQYLDQIDYTFSYGLWQTVRFTRPETLFWADWAIGAASKVSDEVNPPKMATT